MRNRLLLSAAALFAGAVLSSAAWSADALSGATVKHTPASREMPADIDAVTSASVVPPALRQTVKPNGFTTSADKVRMLFVVGDPRSESIEWDLVNTAAKHFMDKGCEVEIRDLYAIGWNPVITRETFFQAKDGFGRTPDDVAREQRYVAATDYIIFAYPNWHDSPNAMVKGYMERVFEKQFAYRDGPKGLEGLLKGKAIFTIMNAGWIGQGRGDVGDGIGQNKIWDKYLGAYKVVDDDTAGFWGVKNLGRFCNDQNPANGAKDYAEALGALRADLIKHLDGVFRYAK